MNVKLEFTNMSKILLGYFSYVNDNIVLLTRESQMDDQTQHRHLFQYLHKVFL